MSVILKSPGEIEAMKAAGQLSAEVLRKVGELVKPGASTLELDEFASSRLPRNACGQVWIALSLATI